jgi:mediator of RNA polymerase II transcription subunit 22
MKLLLLLSDEAQIAHRRDTELKTVQEEKEDARSQVAALLDELIRRSDGNANAGSTSTA